ncbi:hypothetical protein TNCV_112591 [Trichonephila clavipes]|nr:hypothetical protein TNCV_112591 [Trichonephila clavipes]
MPHQINFGNVWKLLGLLYPKNTSKVSLNQCRGWKNRKKGERRKKKGARKRRGLVILGSGEEDPRVLVRDADQKS